MMNENTNRRTRLLAQADQLLKHRSEAERLRKEIRAEFSKDVELKEFSRAITDPSEHNDRKRFLDILLSSPSLFFAAVAIVICISLLLRYSAAQTSLMDTVLHLLSILALASAAGVVVLIISRSKNALHQNWRMLESITTSSTFYFIAGLGLLLYAIRSSGLNHPGLTFVVAMLGVAILLFGTGSQAAGTFDASAAANGWNVNKANVAVAGGAAVLTAIFSWGVLHYSTDIGRVFSNYSRYAIVTVEACGGPELCLASGEGAENLTDRDFSFDQYNIEAESELGFPIHTWHTERAIQILVLTPLAELDYHVRLKAVKVGNDVLTVTKSASAARADNDIDLSFTIKGGGRPEMVAGVDLVEVTPEESVTAQDVVDSVPLDDIRDSIRCYDNDLCRLHQIEDSRDQSGFRGPSERYTLNVFYDPVKIGTADVQSSGLLAPVASQTVNSLAPGQTLEFR
jgi:hypothetical protein